VVRAVTLADRAPWRRRARTLFAVVATAGILLIITSMVLGDLRPGNAAIAVMRSVGFAASALGWLVEILLTTRSRRSPLKIALVIVIGLCMVALLIQAVMG